VLGAVEEVNEEPEGVLGPDDLADPAHGPGGQPPGPAAEGRVVSLGAVQVGGRPDAEAERARRRLGPGAQDEVVVRQLVVASQVERRVVLPSDDEAEQVDPEFP
jgi:hypothetical protein